MGVDRIVHTRVARLVVVVASIAIFLVMGAAFAADSSEGDVGDDRSIAEGRVVYEANCQACHGSDGSGVSGVFPPLLDNPVLDDTTYLAGVITDGRSGELVVAGVTYNGAMPGFSALSQEQVDSLVLYLQEGLGAPVAPPPAPTTPSAPAPGLPFATILAYTAGFGIFAVAAVAVGGPIARVRKRKHTFTTVQVWLKVTVIVIYFVLATVFIPSWVVESSTLTAPPAIWKDVLSADVWDFIRDAIGATVWLVALLAGLFGLRWAQRRDII
jgi:mono/diheme cytochrome c family protein